MNEYQIGYAIVILSISSPLIVWWYYGKYKKQREKHEHFRKMKGK